ncbi:Protein SSUH2 homolog, partial [Geodia barretti]
HVLTPHFISNTPPSFFLSYSSSFSSPLLIFLLSPHLLLPSLSIPTISEEEAREALLETVSAHCCYGKSAAREFIFTNITSSSAFHYELETFAEGRQTAWDHEPYNGQAIDGPQNGPAPQAWSILAQPDTNFRDHRKNFEIPHTASVKACHKCCGGGYNQCPQCLGSTKVHCKSCGGSGRKSEVHHEHHHDHHHHHDQHHHTVPCHCCHGTGRVTCGTCQGRGRVPCDVCLTRGKLKVYLKLTVSWKTHRDEEVVERTDLPDELIKNASGVIAVQDQQLRVYAVTGFPDDDVNRASSRLVQKHASAWPNERILMQRQQVRVVPVAEAACSWKSKTFSYFVYGEDHLVYAPAYPQKLCWGCTIL